MSRNELIEALKNQYDESFEVHDIIGAWVWPSFNSHLDKHLFDVKPDRHQTQNYASCLVQLLETPFKNGVRIPVSVDLMKASIVVEPGFGLQREEISLADPNYSIILRNTVIDAMLNKIEKLIDNVDIIKSRMTKRKDDSKAKGR